VTAAKFPGLLSHDSRHAIVRNIIRRGVPQETAREISGHKSDAVSCDTISSSRLILRWDGELGCLGGSVTNSLKRGPTPDKRQSCNGSALSPRGPAGLRIRPFARILISASFPAHPVPPFATARCFCALRILSWSAWSISRISSAVSLSPRASL
jgi:hypothetical protein